MLRQPRDVFLAVCEGRETEPGYLKRLRFLFGLTNLQIDPGNTGSDFQSLLRRAKNRCAAKDVCDHVYIVCDGGRLGTTVPEYPKFLNLRGGARVPVYVVVSKPCFEYWLLCHFELSDAAFNSAAVLARLRGHWPEYQKTAGVFGKLGYEHVESALRNCEQMRNGDRESGKPFTDMDAFVERLIASVRS